MESTLINFVKLHEDAIIPERGTVQSAGYDLHALNDCEVPANSRVLIPTGIGWEICDGLAVVGIIKDRSSVAYKKGLSTMAGVIDADYRGDIGVVMFNTTDQPVMFNAGDRIAQVVILNFFFTSNDAGFTGVVREGGFGSTGK
jgi:dUTP pyrophosphatase